MLILVLSLCLSALFFAFYCAVRCPKKVAQDAAWVRKVLGIK